MEKRRPRSKQQAQCGADRSRRARRLRAAAPTRPRPVQGPDPKASDGAAGNAGVAATAANAAAAQVPEKLCLGMPLPEKPITRCAFGATRAGALLGRLRLHLQTERFLAVRRDDAVWEAGCLLASVALGDMVAALSEDEMQTSLHGQAQPATLASAPSGIVAGVVHRPVAPSGAGASGAPGAAAPGATAQSEVAR